MKGSCSLVLLLLYFTFSNVQALTYEEVLAQAVGYDKKYASAIYEAQSSEYLPTIARAGLLPKLNLTGFQAANQLTQNTQDALGNPVGTNQNYPSQSYTVQLTQPLINLPALTTYLQSKSQASAAYQQLSIKFNELATNVSVAYYGLAGAKEIYRYTKNEVQTYAEQEAVVVERQVNGAASFTDLEEARYAKLQAEATLADAKKSIEEYVLALQTLTGVNFSSVEVLSSIPEDRLLAENMAQLIDYAKDVNPKVLSQKYRYQSSIYEHEKNRQSYAPTLDLTAYQGYQNSNTLSTIGQKSKQGYLGIQVTIPISSGGETYGKERQSALYADSQRLQLEAEINDIEETIAQLMTQAKTAEVKLKFLTKQTVAAEYIYRSILKQNLLGVKSTYDLLLATRRKYQSERDLSRVKYEKAATIQKLKIVLGEVGGKP